MPSPLNEKLRVLVAPAVTAAGYEMIDVEFKREQVGWVVRVYIDRPGGDPRQPGGGVGTDDCERISREVSALLDVHDVVQQHYFLEVSSPGLDRPLRTPAHFRKFVGQKAKVRLREGLGGRRNFTGIIIGVADDDTTVTVETDDKQRFELPLADLEKSNLDWQF